MFAEHDVNEDWVFRGQTPDKPLLPRIARENSSNDLASREKKLLEEFGRRIAAFGLGQIKSEWELISLAQHYGGPTRLLDWSRSALTALWFSVKDEMPKGQASSPLWMLHLKSGDFESVDTSSPFKGGATKFVEPAHVSTRLLAQESVFSVHRYSDSSGKFVAMERNKIYRERMVKIEIGRAHRSKIEAQLKILGVHAATTFPDLFGLAEFLSKKYKFDSNSVELERRS